MIKTLRYLLFLILLSPLRCLAQSTTVSATITDSDSIAWANGTYSINFVQPAGNSQPAVWNGTLMTAAQKQYTGVLNGSGAFSVSIPDTSYINPPGALWNFIICPNASSGCSQYRTAVTGASLSLTSQLSAAVIAPRFAATGVNAYGYSTVEINQIPVPGGFFWNVTSACQDQWNGSAFACVSAGGGVPSIAATSPITQSGSPGATTVACATCTVSASNGTQGEPAVYPSTGQGVASSADYLDVSQFSGADIGAQINAAYAALPSAGGTLWIPFGTYNFSTPIALTTANKYPTIQANGANLQFTAASGTALTIATGTVAVQNGAILNLNLTDTSAGNTATGVAVGNGTNSNFVRMLNPTINGFKILVSDVSYGLSLENPTFYTCSSSSGSIGVTISGNGDDLHISNGTIAACATNVNLANGNAIYINNTVLANATTDDVANPGGGNIFCATCHFVNPLGTVSKYLNNTGLFSSVNTRFEDDATTGSSTPIVNTGILSNVTSNVYSAGETYPNFADTTNFSWNGSYSGLIGDMGGHISDAYNLSTRGDRQISLSNPDFENSTILPPPGWIANNSSVVSAYETSSQYTGKTQSLKFTSSSQYGGLEYLTAFSVVPGDTYSLQAAIKSDGTSMPNAVLQFQTNTGGFVGNLSISNTTTSWVIETASAVVPATAVKAVLYLQNNTTAGAGTSWFDEISVQKENFSSVVAGSVTVTGPVTATGSLSSGADGVHPGELSLVGNTTLPTLPSNTVNILGPPSATPTSWSLQLPTAIPTTTDLFSCVVASTNCALTDSGIASANVVTLAGTQTLTNKTLTSPALTTPTVTTSETVNNNALASTYAPGSTLQNTTASTSGTTEQNSPSLIQCGTGWTGSINQAYCFRQTMISLGSYAMFVMDSNANGGAYSRDFGMDGAGDFTAQGFLLIDGGGNNNKYLTFGAKGDHINPSGTFSDISGTTTIAASTNGTYTLTFTTAYNNVPSCVVSSRNSLIGGATSWNYQPGTTTLVISQVGVSTSTVTYDYHCFGNPN